MPASTPSVRFLSVKSGASAASIATQLDALLVSLNPCSVQSVEVLRSDRGDQIGAVDLAVNLMTGGTTDCRATSFSGSADQIDQAVSVAFDSAESNRLVVVKDLSIGAQRRVGEGAVLVVYATNNLPRLSAVGSRTCLCTTNLLAGQTVAPDATVEVLPIDGYGATIDAKYMGGTTLNFDSNGNIVGYAVAHPTEAQRLCCIPQRLA